MKNELAPSLPDGAINHNNANSLPFERALIQKGIVPISRDSKLGKAIGSRLSRKGIILHVGGRYCSSCSCLLKRGR